VPSSFVSLLEELREIAPGRRVGEKRSPHAKTSHRVADLRLQQQSL
jgi:hypothetical protein